MHWKFFVFLTPSPIDNNSTVIACSFLRNVIPKRILRIKKYGYDLQARCMDRCFINYRIVLNYSAAGFGFRLYITFLGTFWLVRFLLPLHCLFAPLRPPPISSALCLTKASDRACCNGWTFLFLLFQVGASIGVPIKAITLPSNTITSWTWYQDWPYNRSYES